MGIFDRFRKRDDYGNDDYMNPYSQQKRESSYTNPYKRRDAIRPALHQTRVKSKSFLNRNLNERFDERERRARENKRFYAETYKKTKQQAKQEAIRYRAEQQARRDAGFGFKRPLGTSIAIYGHTTQRTYDQARKTGFIDSLIHGDTHRTGAFDARRSQLGYSRYDRESIFGAKPKKRKRRVTSRSRSSWSGSYIPQDYYKPSHERSVALGSGRKSRFKKPRRHINRRAMSGIEIMHLKQLPSKMGVPNDEFDTTAYIDHSLSYGENKENIQREISQIGGQGGEQMSSGNEEPQEHKTNEQMMAEWKEELEWKARQGDESAQLALDSLKKQGR